MRKVLGVLTVVAMFIFVACGPSKQEIKAKLVADSTRVADSLCFIKHKQDSVAKFKADSVTKADSIAKATKCKKTVKKHKK